VILLNAFSANLLAPKFPATVVFHELTVAETRKLLGTDFKSVVGHKDTAAVFSTILGVPVVCNRETVTLYPGDSAIIGQYSGPRLQEGATSLPTGAAIKWLFVLVYDDYVQNLDLTPHKETT
jgi:hypothetical protein